MLKRPARAGRGPACILAVALWSGAAAATQIMRHLREAAGVALVARDAFTTPRLLATVRRHMTWQWHLGSE